MFKNIQMCPPILLYYMFVCLSPVYDWCVLAEQDKMCPRQLLQCTQRYIAYEHAVSYYNHS